MNGTPPTAALERRNVRRSILCLALFLTLVTTPVQATAEPELRVKVADAALVRPLAAIGAVLSTAAFFVAVVPAWVVGVDERDLAHHMVKRPWYYVHGRELGNFDDTL
jgi:hypothetical protein